MAYALGSMVQILEQDQYNLNLCIKSQIESLLQKARLMIDIIEKSSPMIQEMELRIIDAAHRAEDMIEFHIAGLASELEWIDVMNEFNSIIEDVSTKQANSFIQILNSLIQIVEPDQYILNLHTKHEIEFLFQKARLLRDVVEKSFPILKETEIRIRDVAQAEDIIEFHKTDRFDLPHQASRLIHMMEKIDSVIEDMVNNPLPPPPPPPSPSPPPPPPVPASRIAAPSSNPPAQSWTNIVVSFDRDINQLLFRLTEPSLLLKIIPIVGTEGIGKTTLARAIYNHPSIVSHFDVRAWITLSEVDHNDVHATQIALLDNLAKLTNQIQVKNSCHETIQDILGDRRFIIVVDSVWHIGDWVKLKEFLPDTKNGSRIILTTRIPSVQDLDSSLSSAHDMHLLHDEPSWQLLSQKLFGKEGCPPMLVRIGRKIAYTCRGNPLAIAIVAGILSTIEKRLEYYQKFFLTNSSSLEESNISAILLMSYNHLPYYLKPCFLYIGFFPEDHEIRASKIIKLWIAEGFIKQVTCNNLEDTAQAYLEALISRNLLLVSQLKLNGKIKKFKIHNILRDFCLKKSDEEKFMWFKDLVGPDFREENRIIRRLSVHSFFQHSNLSKEKSSESSKGYMPLTRSFLCIGLASQHVASMFYGLRLLRVLDVFQLEFFQFPVELLQLVLLRYLAFSCHSDLPSSIYKFPNLQTLVIRRLPSYRAFSLPAEFWEMAQLRHIKSKETCIWYYPTNGKNVVLEKLQTLSVLQMFGVTNQFLEKIPNLRKLSVFGNTTMHTAINLACLDKLETLKCSSDLSRPTWNFLSSFKLPPSLKKLTLSLCMIPWQFIESVGNLPNLEQLKLQKSDFIGTEWNLKKQKVETTEQKWEPAKGGFVRLRSLLMEDLNLVHWNVDSANFPVLRSLVIFGCHAMKEIPFGIGSISTLELIKVDKCSPSVRVSAIRILDDQKDCRNGFLRGIIDNVEYQNPSLQRHDKVEIPSQDFVVKEVDQAVSVQDIRRRKWKEAASSTETTSTESSGLSRVMAFHSSPYWKRYFNYCKQIKKLIVVYFTATWCKPSETMEPIFNDLSVKYTNVDFIKIDTDELPDAEDEFGHGVPLFVLLKQGKELGRVVGAYKDELEMKIMKYREVGKFAA